MSIEIMEEHDIKGCQRGHIAGCKAILERLPSLVLPNNRPLNISQSVSEDAMTIMTFKSVSRQDVRLKIGQYLRAQGWNLLISDFVSAECLHFRDVWGQPE